MDGAFPSGVPSMMGQEGASFDPMGFPGPGRGAGGRSGFRGTAENSKTKICTRWQDGDCRFGDRCNFAHGEHELRAAPDQHQDGGRGYSAGRGRGYAGRGAPGGGRGYGGGRAYGGYPAGYQAGYEGMGQPLQAMQSGYDQRPGGLPEEVWAAQGYPVGGPNGWCMYRAKDTGEVYFHNHRSNVTTWEQPLEWQVGGGGI